jgi:hypothetical protein
MTNEEKQRQERAQPQSETCIIGVFFDMRRASASQSGDAGIGAKTGGS